MLVSCGEDGSVYEWDMSHQGKRRNEIVIKNCSHFDISLTDNTNDKEELLIYSVGNDKTIKEIKRFLTGV